KDWHQGHFWGAFKASFFKPSILRTGFVSSIRVLFSTVCWVVRICTDIGSPLWKRHLISRNVDCISCRCSYDDCSAYKTASSTHCSSLASPFLNSSNASVRLAVTLKRAELRCESVPSARTVLSYHSSCLSKARCALNCLMACSAARYPVMPPVKTPV